MKYSTWAYYYINTLSITFYLTLSQDLLKNWNQCVITIVRDFLFSNQTPIKVVWCMVFVMCMNVLIIQINYTIRLLNYNCFFYTRKFIIFMFWWIIDVALFVVDTNGVGLSLGVILVFKGTYLGVNVDIVLILVILQMTKSLESILIVYNNNIFWCWSSFYGTYIGDIAW